MNVKNLVLCPSCTRHSRRTEERCPFCGVALSDELRNAAPPPMPPRGLSRAKRYAFHAAIATGLASSVATCGGTTTTDAGVTDAANDGSSGNDAAKPADGSVLADGQADAQTDGQPNADVVEEDVFMPPPPYGCVFPEGCGDVKV